MSALARSIWAAEGWKGFFVMPLGLVHAGRTFSSLSACVYLYVCVCVCVLFHGRELLLS